VYIDTTYYLEAGDVADNGEVIGIETGNSSALTDSTEGKVNSA
jgi:uncharacterized protein YuzE